MICVPLSVKGRRSKVAESKSPMMMFGILPKREGMTRSAVCGDDEVIVTQKGAGFFEVRQVAVGKDDDTRHLIFPSSFDCSQTKKILRWRRMAVIESKVPPLVLTRSGNAGRAVSSSQPVAKSRCSWRQAPRSIV